MTPEMGQPFNPYKRFNGIHIPEAICKYRGLSAGAKLVYGRLCRFAGKHGRVYPSIPTLGSELGTSANQIRRYVRELEAKKFIGALRRPGKSSQYEFLWHSAFDGELGKGRKRRGSTPVNGSSTPPINGSTSTPVNGTPVNGRRRESIVLRESSSRESFEESQPKPKPILSGADDEKPKPQSPEARLKAWAVTRGDPLSARDWFDIQAAAEIRGVSMEVLAGLAERNDGNWKSSGAGLRWLTRNFRSKTTDAPDEAPKPKPIERCDLCHGERGRGALLVDGKIEPCECASAEWREVLSRANERDAKRNVTDQRISA